MARSGRQGKAPRAGASRAGSGRPFGAKGAGKGAGKGRDFGKGASGRPFGKGAGKGPRGPRGGSRAGACSSRSDLIEGRRAVVEALECGVPLKRAYVSLSGDSRDGQDLARIASRLEAAGVAVERVPKARLDQMSSHGAHQGVVVQASDFPYADLADVIRAAGEGDALIVLLDHVTDEGNFGAIVRSAEVVGAAGVVIAKARAAKVGVGAYKTSAGAVLHLPIAQVSNLATAIDQVKEAGFWVAGSTEHATQDVWEAPMGGRLCLVMGSEGSGISRLVREKCDFECKLPQRGRVESLNVAQATTVMCYEWLRRTHESQAHEG